MGDTADRDGDEFWGSEASIDYFKGEFTNDPTNTDIEGELKPWDIEHFKILETALRMQGVSKPLTKEFYESFNELDTYIKRLLAQAEQRALRELLSNQLPWPEDIFGRVPEDDWSEIDNFAKTRGYRIDTISGDLMRRGWKCLERLAKQQIEELEEAAASKSEGTI